MLLLVDDDGIGQCNECIETWWWDWIMNWANDGGTIVSGLNKVLWALIILLIMTGSFVK